MAAILQESAMDGGDLPCETMAKLSHDIRLVNELIGNITCTEQSVVCARLAGFPCRPETAPPF